MTPPRNEEARHAVLAFLAGRPALRFGIAAITRGVNREGGDYAEAEIKATLRFLWELQLVSSEFDPLGSTPYFQITAKGTLHHERGGAT